MELVNNRYRIIKNLNQNRLVSTYLVSDIWDEYKEVQLNMLNSEFIPNSLIEFYTNEFISLINLNNENIVKNYTFSIISRIDNKRSSEEHYFYTCEYVRESQGLLEYIENMNSFQIMDVFMELCKAVNYLHMKGYAYGALNFNNIMLVESMDSYKLMLKDIATVELEKNFSISDKKDDSYFMSPKVLSGEKPSIESDIYSLGVLLLTMLRKQSYKLSPKEELTMFMQKLKSNKNTDYSSDEIDFLRKLLPIIDKLIISNEAYPFGYLYEFIDKLNKTLNRDYTILSMEEFERLTLHTKIIAREDEINNILTSYELMIRYKPVKKIFVVQGDTGTGKTRFLEEIKFLLELKNANVFSSFSLNSLKDSSNKMWVDVLRKLILESDTETIEKYESELMKFFPEIGDRNNTIPTEYLKEETTKYRLLNRIAGFISDSIKSRPVIIIIDNIHFANEFTIDTFTYLCTEVIKDKNIILIFSYRDGEASNNSKFLEFISNIKTRKDSDTIYMKDLDVEQSSQMIKNMLSMPTNPLMLAKRIYSQSYGNPLFISEIIKDLYNRRVIYVDSKLGKWSIDVPEDSDYKLLSLPNNIEQAVLNQIKDSDDISDEIIKVISIYNNPVSIADLARFINISFVKLENAVQKLVDKGTLCRKIEDSGYVYDINNKVLKDIVYVRISSEEKIKKHKIASEILEMEKDINSAVNMNELIFHLEKANIKEKVKKYCIENAKRMHALKDNKAEIKNLEKALSMADNKLEKTGLLIQIGLLNFEAGYDNVAIEYLTKAEKLTKITKDSRNMLDLYLSFSEILPNLNKVNKALKYLEKAGKILESYGNTEDHFEYKRIKALLLFVRASSEESASLCLELLNECSDEYAKTKGNAYRLLAFMYSRMGKTEEALELYKKGVKLLETAGYTRGILYALNNIGGIYTDFYQDSETALKYFIRVKNLSEEYGLLSSEILGLLNIAVIYSIRFNYQAAYDYYKLALGKTAEFDFSNNTFFLYNSLAFVCLDMDNYSEAFHYNNLCQKLVDKSLVREIDIAEFYKSSANLYEIFGDFKKSEEYVSKAMKLSKNDTSISKFDLVIQDNINKLRFNDKGTYNTNIKKILANCEKFVSAESKINSLSNAAEVLCAKKDYKNAKKMLIEAEKSMSDSVHGIVKAKYYYAKGLIETEEDCAEVLLKGLKLAKDTKNKKLIAKITTQLGNYYFSKGNYYYSANYYIEACELLKNLIYQVPDDYKLIYINSYELASVFYRVKYIKDILSGTENSKIEKLEVESFSDLYDLLKIDEASSFMENKDFIHSISELYKSNLQKNIISEEAILSSITSDAIKNIELVIKYLAASTLSTRGLVVIEGQRQDLSVISSINESYNLPSNRYIFDRAKVSMEPILLSKKSVKNESDTSLLSEDLYACLCIPIMTNYSQNSIRAKEEKVKALHSRENIIGYLYLESDRILNNFTDEGLKKCIRLCSFLALLIEKHQLTLAASIDKLTGALTRKYLEDTLRSVMERSSSYGEAFSIIMYDLDKFKNVNDRFGHQTGDEVLRRVSRVVMDNIGRDDYLGRYGGEEFIVILPGKGIDEALIIADELRKKIQHESMLANKTGVTVSMGVVSYPAHGQIVKELVEKADQALYAAKESGRNRCQAWDSEFINKAKPTNTLSGIISGDSVQDSRNTLALVELIQIVNKNIPRNEKIYSFLGRMIEIIEAQLGTLILIENDKILEVFGRKFKEEKCTQNINFNKSIVKSVIDSKQGGFLIDWDDVGSNDIITGLPDWYSILAVPIMVQDEVRGVIYLSALTKNKEFGVNELNFINVLSNLVAAIIK